MHLTTADKFSISSLGKNWSMSIIFELAHSARKTDVDSSVIVAFVFWQEQFRLLLDKKNNGNIQILIFF